MDYAEFIDAARHAAGGGSREATERTVQSTLQTLAERLPRGEARHILRELPAELTPWIYTETDAEPFGIDEFLARVARVAASSRHVQWRAAGTATTIRAGPSFLSASMAARMVDPVAQAVIDHDHRLARNIGERRASGCGTAIAARVTPAVPRPCGPARLGRRCRAFERPGAGGMRPCAR
jgi:uncharacterized protein (DUF2267 family)